jgi:hypothetical protein
MTAGRGEERSPVRRSTRISPNDPGITCLLRVGVAMALREAPPLMSNEGQSQLENLLARTEARRPADPRDDSHQISLTANATLCAGGG